MTLISKNNETQNVKTFVFKPGSSFLWEAGQYLIYSLPHKPQDTRGKIRFFTISSPPFQKNPSITTRITSNSSSFKKTLDNLKTGDEIEAKGPDGDFVLKNAEKKYVFIAGGIGITPFISIIKELEHNNLPINITLLYANKNRDIPFKKTLDEAFKKHPEFKIYYFISSERIDKNSLKNMNWDFKKLIFYVSGPDPMVEAMEKTLDELGVDKKRVKLDYFSGYKGI